MERLTLRSSETSHENGVCCTHFKSKDCLEVGGNCAYGCKWEEAVWARLAEFEDSGLETWQADAAKSIVEMAFGGEISSIERIRDLVRADKAGMNITLPCKPGDKTVCPDNRQFGWNRGNKMQTHHDLPRFRWVVCEGRCAVRL